MERFRLFDKKIWRNKYYTIFLCRSSRDGLLLFIRVCLFFMALMLLRGFRKKGGKNQNEVELMDAYENKH